MRNKPAAQDNRIGFRLSPRHHALFEALRLPHINRSGLINRALDFGLDKAIREMTRAVQADERN